MKRKTLTTDMQQDVKRGPWSQACKNCKHYESKRCTKLDINTNPKDWCNSWKPEDKPAK